jgi:UDP-glucose:(heptosyl)LPS alpha-1,3-glucosyltransferase
LKSSIAFLKSGLAHRGGLEKACFALARFFQNAGHEVSVLTTDWTNQLQTDFLVENLGKRSRSSLYHTWSFDRKCASFLKQQPHDIVFGMDRNFCTQHFYRAGNGVHAAYLENRKQFSNTWKRLSFAINPQHQLILSMERATFESPALRCLFTNSEMVRQEIAQFYPRVDLNKVFVVHNGVEWQAFDQPFEEGFQEGLQVRSQIAKSLGLDPSRYQFLFVGHEYQRKGLSLLLKALAELSSYCFELSVVGKERHIAAFKQQAAALHLSDRVHFFGMQADVKPYFQVADSLVVPSYYDPFANVTVEALAFGLWVISSAKNGGSEVLTPENGAVFQDLQQPDQLVSCLQQALKKPKTYKSAKHIRNSVAQLDFSQQLHKIMQQVGQNF